MNWQVWLEERKNQVIAILDTYALQVVALSANAFVYLWQYYIEVRSWVNEAINVFWDQVIFVCWQHWYNTKWVINDKISNIRTVADTWYNTLTKYVVDWVTKVIKLVEGIFDALVDIAESLYTFVDRICRALYNTIVYLAETIYNMIVRVCRDLYNHIDYFCVHLFAAVQYLVEDLGEQLDKILKAIYDKIVQVCDYWYNFVSTLVLDWWNQLTGFCTGWWTYLRSLIFDWWLHLVDWLGNFYTKAKEFFSSEYQDVLVFFQNPAQTIFDLMIDRLFDWLDWWLAGQISGNFDNKPLF